MLWDLIALGETMLAFAPPAHTPLGTARSVSVDHAGAETNTCVGLARLGFHVAWVSRLGADPAGDRIVDALNAEGVATEWVRRDPDRPTGILLKDRGAVHYYRRGSAASVMAPDDLHPVPIADARAVLVTGVTALIGPGPHAAGLALLSRARGLRVVDPNLRGGLWGSDRRVALVSAFIERCDVLLGGAAELRELLTADDDEALARRALDRGAREVVVRGSRSVGALVDGVWRTLAIDRGEAVDPVGAGDAFNAGYLAVRLRGGSVDEALGAGAHCGAAVTSTPSDTSAFPRSLA
jgi:2-dehydro-3-deoxygluconokinase